MANYQYQNANGGGGNVIYYSGSGAGGMGNNPCVGGRGSQPQMSPGYATQQPTTYYSSSGGYNQQQSDNNSLYSHQAPSSPTKSYGGFSEDTGIVQYYTSSGGGAPRNNNYQAPQPTRVNPPLPNSNSYVISSTPGPNLTTYNAYDASHGGSNYDLVGKTTTTSNNNSYQYQSSQYPTSNSQHLYAGGGQSGAISDPYVGNRNSPYMAASPQPQIAAYPIGNKSSPVTMMQQSPGVVMVGGGGGPRGNPPNQPAQSQYNKQPQPAGYYGQSEPQSYNQPIAYTQPQSYNQPQSVVGGNAPRPAAVMKAPMPQPVSQYNYDQPEQETHPQQQYHQPQKPAGNLVNPTVPPMMMGQGYNQVPPRVVEPSKRPANKPQKRRDYPEYNSGPRGSMTMDNGFPMEGPPQFVAQPAPSLAVMESDPVTISARVKPAGDSSLKTEWFRNGKPLTAASRFNPTFDRGYAVLEFLYTHEDDNGEYYCVAESNSGRDQSTTCHLTVHTADSVVTETQLPEESMVANLAAMEEYLEQNDLLRNRRVEEQAATQPPVFLRQLVPQLGLRENHPAHFECIVEPANDPNLVVEWYKDGQPVSMGCRFNATLDRGFAILDIAYCRAEDSGHYCCIAKNSRGEIQSNVVQLHCSEEGGIITQSALSKDSIAYLESLDSWGTDVMATFDTRPAPEDTEEPAAPSFVIFPKPTVALEGTPARFLVRADGHPRPRVQWYINGDLIASSGQGGNWRIYQDGGISYLEFHRCGIPAHYDIKIVAKNQLGEATAETTLDIEPQPDYRPDLKHVQPENNFKKLMALKHVDLSAELVKKMQKPKADATELRKIERINEFKGKTIANNDINETENLYMKVQQNLRSGMRAGVLMSNGHHNDHNSQPPMQMGAGGMMNGVNAHEADEEYFHEETSAEFTIDL